MEAFIFIAFLVGIIWIIVGAVNWISMVITDDYSRWPLYNLPQKIFFTFCCGPLAWFIALIIRPTIELFSYLLFDLYTDIMEYLGTFSKKD